MMSLFKQLLSDSSVSTKQVYLKGMAVGDSRDLRRIVALPRRDRPSDAVLSQWATELKAKFGTGAASCLCETKFKRRCCQDLLPIQAWLLHEAHEVGGILGPVGVGHGKSLCDLLVAMVVPSRKNAVLLLPPNLKSQMLETDWHFYGQHWKLPNLAGGKTFWPDRPTLHVIAYSELSGSRATDLLHRVRPDMVILDEAHSVRNRTAARTKRFLRYFHDHPECMLFAWSGTLTARSLRDYAHLSNLALRDLSPTPHHHPTIEEWAGHLDSSEFRSPPGRLEVFGPDARVGFGKRVVETLGVVSSGDNASCQASIVISERPLQAPEEIKKQIEALKESWDRPDGDPLVDAMSVGRCARELSCGFYYRWRWPRKEPRPVIERWLLARKNWHKELREKLKHAKAHMDSPLLCAKAAIRWQKGYTYVERDEEGREKGRRDFPPGTARGPLPTWKSEFWPEWEEVRDTAKPETEAVWLSDFLVEDCIEWLREGPGLLWYEFDGLAKRIMRNSKEHQLPICFAGPGTEGDVRVRGLEGTESVVASIRAHGTGKHLHMFNRSLVANPPSSGSDWEQLMGRTHRLNQKADEVTFEVYRHTEPMIQAVEKARELSSYIQESFGATQKLASKATWKF